MRDLCVRMGRYRKGNHVTLKFEGGTSAEALVLVGIRGPGIINRTMF